MTTLTKIGLAVACLSLTLSSAAAATLHTDDFNSGTTTLGWGGGASPTRQASGGVGNTAFLQIASGGSNLATFNDADDWTGDLAVVGAAKVTVSLMAPVGSSPLSIRLVLFGPNSINDRWVSQTVAQVPANGQWSSHQYNLAESEMTLAQGSGSFAELMASTVRVMFRHNPVVAPDGSPVVGTLGLDDITLAAIPEPATLAMTLLAAAALPRLRRRRTCNRFAPPLAA